jgi:hypothetical protein
VIADNQRAQMAITRLDRPPAGQISSGMSP